MQNPLSNVTLLFPARERHDMQRLCDAKQIVLWSLEVHLTSCTLLCSVGFQQKREHYVPMSAGLIGCCHVVQTGHMQWSQWSTWLQRPSGLS